MPRIFDNIDKALLPALQSTLEVTERADFCVGYFNLRGWRHLSGYVDRWGGGPGNCCRLLIGMHLSPSDELRRALRARDDGEALDNQTAVREKRQIAEDFRDQLTYGVPTNADEAGLRQLSRHLRVGKLLVKVHLRHPLHARLYLLFRQDPINPVVGYLGSSNLTLAGLSHQGELNIDVVDSDATAKLADWFEDRWRDRWCVDISKELAEIIDQSWAGQDLVPPYHVYLKMAFHLAQEARAGLSEFRIPPVFGNSLFDFQVAAVKIAAHHLHKRGGVLIGDVVGLGKSMMATALAKVFEEDFNTETLILCPKNLVPMWEDYAHRYRLHAKVLSISKAIQELPERTRRYRVVLIDESHNLRNHVVLHALENGLDIPLGTQGAELLDTRYYDEDPETQVGAEDDNGDSEQGETPESVLGLRSEADFSARAARVYADYAGPLKSRFKWLPATLFTSDLAQHLQSDAGALLQILAACGAWNPEHDAKLAELVRLIGKKHNKDKLLVFTQFADTARYLKAQLLVRGIGQVEEATGQTANPTDLAWRFSPESSGKSDQVRVADELRVLIATDVLSEGQNLQDCAIIVNYDLPWAIVRLIQRAGRVDSYAYQIWKNATDADPALAARIEGMPNVVYATKAHHASPEAPCGVLVYLRTGQGNDALTWIDEAGNSVTQSQLTILKAAACAADTPALPRAENHHELTARGMQHVLDEEKSTGGALGRPSGARFKTYECLKRYRRTIGTTRDLFITDAHVREIDRAMEEIYRYPLCQAATDVLNRQIKAGIDDHKLAELVGNLREEGRLCVIDEQESQREPRLICSLGLV